MGPGSGTCAQTSALAREYKLGGIGVFAFPPGSMCTGLFTRPDVIAGYERRIPPLKTVVRMWAREALRRRLGRTGPVGPSREH